MAKFSFIDNFYNDLIYTKPINDTAKLFERFEEFSENQKSYNKNSFNDNLNTHNKILQEQTLSKINELQSFEKSNINKVKGILMITLIKNHIIIIKCASKILKKWHMI